MRSIQGSIGGLVAVVLLASPAAAQGPAKTQFEQALELSRQSGRPLLAMLGSPT